MHRIILAFSAVAALSLPLGCFSPSSTTCASSGTVCPPGWICTADELHLITPEVTLCGDGTVGDGARVSAIRLGDAEGRLRYEPDHPLADENGYVRTPDMDLETQMTSLIVAQRSYQANVTVFERARDSYQRALEIGR